MYLSIIICENNIYQKAKSFFLQEWRSDLMVKDQNSLIWAYLVTQYLRQNGKPNYMFVDGVYTYEEMYFSTSHSDDFLVIAVDNKKVAVDIEFIHHRDASLLRNVKILKSPYNNWENFYIQWSAKECLVKFLNLTSNDMKDMKIVKFDPHKHFSVDEWEFSSLLTLWYKWKDYRVHIQVKNGAVVALLKESSSTAKKTTTPPPLPDNWKYLCSMEREWMFKPIDF